MAIAHNSKAFGGYKNTSLGSAPQPATPPAPQPQAPAPGAGPAAPAGVTRGPDMPPTIQPFLRPEDLQSIAEFDWSNAQNNAELDAGIQSLSAQTDYNKAQNNTNALKSATAAKDDAAARGVFGSSIQAGNLADIEAQRAIRESFFNTQLANAKLRAQNLQAAIAQHAQDFTKAMQEQMKTNAENVPVAPAGSGEGAAANGSYGGVQYLNGSPQTTPTAESVLKSGSLIGTGMDGSAVQQAKRAVAAKRG